METPAAVATVTTAKWQLKKNVLNYYNKEKFTCKLNQIEPHSKAKNSIQLKRKKNEEK